MVTLPYVAACNYHLCSRIVREYVFNRGICEYISIVRSKSKNHTDVSGWKIMFSHKPDIYLTPDSRQWIGFVPPVDIQFVKIFSSYMENMVPDNYHIRDANVEAVYLLGEWHHMWSVVFEMKPNSLENMAGPACVRLDLKGEYSRIL